MTNRIQRKAAARIPLYFNQERSNGNPTGDLVCQYPRAEDDIDFSKFLSSLKKMISSEDYERAINFCKSVSKTSLPKITLRAIEASENDPTTVRGTIEEETIEFLPKIENRINTLPALATLIMLIGILGTIDRKITEKSV